MVLNFTGMVPAPDTPRPTRYRAYYSNGFGIIKKTIEAENRLQAYAIATVRLPEEGFTLTNLRKLKS